MLQPETETYRGNKITLTVTILVTLLVAYGVFLLLSERETLSLQKVLFCAPALGVPAFAVFWLFSLRVSLHPDGISKESFLGRKEMRWDDVNSFFYAATKRSVNFIPIGTYYSFRLIDRDGNKISFGNSVERPLDVGTKMIQYTHAPLLKKAAEQFDSGVELNFGPVRMSRAGGIKIKKLFREKQIAINEVASYRIDAGHLYIFKVGEKRTTGPAISQIPNAFVLIGLLNAIYKAPAQ
ncbi:MAG: DUF6585 family protein [Candidatus Acidiferrales bacterium]